MDINPPNQPDQPLVAVINTAKETIELLQGLLEDEGLAVVTPYIVDFKRGVQDLQTFFETQHPQVVVYDIALPYIENWTFFCEYVLTPDILRPVRFVITTTNKSVLETLVG